MDNVVLEVVELDFADESLSFFTVLNQGDDFGFLGRNNFPLVSTDLDCSGLNALAVNDRRNDAGLAETTGSVVSENGPGLGRDFRSFLAHGLPFFCWFILFIKGLINVYQYRTTRKWIFRRGYV